MPDTYLQFLKLILGYFQRSPVPSVSVQLRLGNAHNFNHQTASKIFGLKSPHFLWPGDMGKYD